jgi:hypothetical protein
MRVHRQLIAVVLLACSCGTGDNRLDPRDLGLRDLLGIAPEVATTWDADQRAAAREVLAASCDDAAPPVSVALPGGASLDDRVAQSLADHDLDLDRDGSDALALVHVVLAPASATVAESPATATKLRLGSGAAPGVDVQLSAEWNDHAWGDLATRNTGVLAALVADAGGSADSAVIVPASRLPVIAAYLDDRAELLVNPVLLAALEPAQTDVAGAVSAAHAAPANETVRLTKIGTSVAHPAERAPSAKPATDPGGNPYSFYGSVEECAAAQSARCTACLADDNCQAIEPNGDGAAECNTLGSDGGQGYFLICINLALAITSVDTCASSAAPSCARDPSAADSIEGLQENADFLTSPCAGALDGCLAQIYGAPSQQFPGLDGGIEPSEPPRSTSVSCSNSCSDQNNCSFSPSCTGPSGCTGSCDSCSSNTSSPGTCSGGGGTSSSSSSGCGGSSSSSSGCSGGSCSGNSCSGNSCSGDSCGSGGGCNGDGCGSGGCSGSGGSCGNSSNGQCSVAGPPNAAIGMAISIMWALLPIPAAVLARRKKRRRRRGSEGEVVR